MVHYYGTWSLVLTFVSATVGPETNLGVTVGPETNLGISPGSNG